VVQCSPLPGRSGHLPANANTVDLAHTVNECKVSEHEAHASGRRDRAHRLAVAGVRKPLKTSREVELSRAAFATREPRPDETVYSGVGALGTRFTFTTSSTGWPAARSRSNSSAPYSSLFTLLMMTLTLPFCLVVVSLEERRSQSQTSGSRVGLSVEIHAGLTW